MSDETSDKPPASGIVHNHPPCPCKPVELLDRTVIYMFPSGYVCRW